MVNNSPISLLAGLLDFSLNSLACLAGERGFTNPSCTKLPLGPRRLRHPESPVVAITQNYSYGVDAEQNGKTISTLLRGNSCSILLLEDDRFPFLSHSIPLTFFLFSIFVSIFSFTSSFFLCFLCLVVFISAFLSLFLTHFILQSLSLLYIHTHTLEYAQLHTRERWKYIPRNISERNFNRALSHFELCKKNTNMLFANRVEQCVTECACVLFLQYCPNVTARAQIQRLYCKSCHLWVRIKVRRAIFCYL